MIPDLLSPPLFMAPSDRRQPDGSIAFADIYRIQFADVGDRTLVIPLFTSVKKFEAFNNWLINSQRVFGMMPFASINFEGFEKLLRGLARDQGDELRLAIDPEPGAKEIDHIPLVEMISRLKPTTAKE